MNLESLKYFKHVAEIKSISKVSTQFHISQSALSQLIQKLEENIGYELLSRSNKGVELTKMGKVVYEYADTILKNYQKMIDELSWMEQDKNSVIINSTWAISNYSLPSFLVEVKNKFPHIHYELCSNRSEDIVKNVENGLSDIGVIYCDRESDVLQSIHICDEQIVLVAMKDYKIPDKISVQELFRYQFINFKNGCYNTNVYDTISKYLMNLNENTLSFNPLLNLDSISAVKSSVSEGFGISFLPYSAVRKEIIECQFKIIEIKNIKLTLKVNVISLKNDKISPSVKKVIDLFLKFGPKSLC